MTETVDPAGAGEPDEPDDAELVVVREPGGEDGDEADVRDPDRLLRLAGQVRGLVNQLDVAELDESGRARLAAVHADLLDGLRAVVSDELRAELDELTIAELDEVPTAVQLRIAQTQLGGWLEGLFHGLRASAAGQQAVQKRQLMQQLGHGGDPDGPGGSDPSASPGDPQGGQYL